jgi:hypothetical protein
MKTILVPLVIALSLLASAAAQAATFQGRASDGTKVRLRTNAHGKPSVVKFGHYKADCDSGYTSITNPISGFIHPFDAATRTQVLDRGRKDGTTELDGVSGEVHVVGTWHFEAHLSDGRWIGTYRTRGNYEQNGQRITRCATRFSFALNAR